MTRDNTGLTQSLCKAFDILDCFTPETPALRVVDITKRVGMTQSSVSRLLGTMVACGYLERVEETGSYQLGRRIISLSGVALNHSELRKQALPELFRLEQHYETGANLAVLDHDRMYYLAHVDSRTSPRMYTMVGHTNPLHCTAIGKILLAAMSDEEIEAVLDRTGLPSFTYHTITDRAALLEQLQDVRRLGYATEYNEHAMGSACIAAAIYDRSGRVVAGLSMSGKFRGQPLKDHETEVAAIVQDAAALISNKLGYL